MELIRANQHLCIDHPQGYGRDRGARDRTSRRTRRKRMPGSPRRQHLCHRRRSRDRCEPGLEARQQRIVPARGSGGPPLARGCFRRLNSPREPTPHPTAAALRGSADAEHRAHVVPGSNARLARRTTPSRHRQRAPCRKSPALHGPSTPSSTRTNASRGAREVRPRVDGWWRTVSRTRLRRRPGGTWCPIDLALSFS